MTTRPISLTLAVGLLLLIGLSGMAVGGSLLGYAIDPQAPGRTPTLPGVQEAAALLGAGIACYGFVTVVAGVGLVLLRRWGWRLGVVTVLTGLIALAGVIVAAGAADSILLFGILFWGATLACVVAAPTRNAVGA